MSSGREKNNITAEILVVEDSQVQAEALKHILEENGYAVSLAYNGMEGVEKLENFSFSLIISDIIMPVMDGYEFCLKVKSDERHRDIPVMLLTELSEPEDIIKGLQCGADNFLTKPYSDENLLNRIKHLMINCRLRKNGSGELAVGIFFRGKNYIINSDKQQILDLLISVFETAIEKNRELIISSESQQTLIEMLTAKNDELARSYAELEEIRNTLEERVRARTADRDKQITRHLMTIETLRLSDDKYRMLTERMTDILWTIDNNLNLTYISPSVEKILGFTPEERMLQTIDDMLTPESSALVQRILKDEFEQEQRGADPDRIIAPELSLYHKNGTVRIFENSIIFIRDREGKPAGFQGMSRDITEHKEMAKLLRDREERFKSILEALNDWVWEVDCNGRYTYSSPRGSSLLGYDPDEIIGKTPFDLMPPDEAVRVGAIFGGIAAEGRPFNGLENSNIRKNGEIIVLETSGSPFFSEKGELLGYRGVDRDITKRKEYEKIIEKSTLREGSLNRISEVFLTVQDESVYKDVLSIILDISGSREGFFGYIDDKGALVVPTLLGEIMKECMVENKTFIFPPDTWGKSIWGRAIREKKTFISNTPLSGLPDNHIKIHNNIVVPVISREKVIGIINLSNCESEYTDETVTLIEDIILFISPIMNARIERDRKETERQQYEDELLKHQLHLEELVTARTGELMNERDRINAIISSVPDGIIVTDMQQSVILMNHSAEELLGICFQSVQNQPISIVIHEETLREKLKHIIDRLKTEYEFDFTLHKDHNGSERTMHGKTSVIIDRDDKKQGTVTILSDVTNIREIDRMKTEFISTAAHELRTPLTSIQGFSEILLTRENLDENEQKKYLSYINRQAVKLAKIVGDLLDIARIESGKGFTISRENCSLEKLFSDVVPYFENLGLKQRFEVRLPGKPVSFFADISLMEQVLKNLLSNAIKYSPGGGIIKISGDEDNGFVKISVEDQGIGMTTEQSSKIFEKFYRADASDSAPEGTGLGMTIVKYIVETHGGKIWIESVYGDGTKVFFTIPLEEFSIC